jgi:hypothetical protein
MADEQEDLLAQFLSDSDASAKDKETLDFLVNVSPIDTRLKQLVVKLTDWCYYEGYDDGEAGRQ